MELIGLIVNVVAALLILGGLLALIEFGYLMGVIAVVVGLLLMWVDV
jgi:hypothetical protein